MSDEPTIADDDPGADLPLPAAEDWRRLAGSMQAPIAALARFVTAAGSVANDAERPVAARLRKLRAMEAALSDGDPQVMDGPCATARRLGRALDEAGVPDQAARRFLQGQRKWLEPGRFADWNDLLLHSRAAAGPLARMLLDLADVSDPAARAKSEVLAAALRILVGLRDAGRDYAVHGRLIIPVDWFHEAALSPDRLRAASAEGQTRAIFDRVLDGVDRLLAEAAGLPSAIPDSALRGLAAETLLLGTKLAWRLRHQDPLAGRVALTASDRLVCRWRARLAWIAPSRLPRRAG